MSDVIVKQDLSFKRRIGRHIREVCTLTLTDWFQICLIFFNKKICNTFVMMMVQPKIVWGVDFND